MADKGINLPESALRLPSLTSKDLADLRFIAANADIVGYSFVRTESDVFDLQDEVARMIATTVPGRVRAVGTERAHRKPTENMSAYENYLRALEYLDGYDRLALAEPFILRAVELDPRFAMAQVLLCLLTVNKYFFDADRSHLEKAAALGRKALALDESDGMCHVAVAHPLTFQRRHDEAGSAVRPE